MTALAPSGIAVDDASVRSALATLTDLATAPPRPAACPTGFSPLDTVFGGGLGRGDLVVLGGRPGVGKTIAALQWARHVASTGAVAIYACYEHDQPTLLTRMLAGELAEAAGRLGVDDEMRLDGLRAGLRAAALGRVAIAELIGSDPLLGDAAESMRCYAERLLLVRASGTRTGMGALSRLVTLARDRFAGREVILVVDYLQKVPVQPEPADEAERVKRVAEQARELALSSGVAVVGIVAADREGLTARRLRTHHFRGSTALAYEPDSIIVLNEKLSVVSKVHLSYDLTRADAFRRQVVFSVEKNRNGPTEVDIEFTKDFPSYRFHPKGSWVTERLWTEGTVEA